MSQVCSLSSSLSHAVCTDEERKMSDQWRRKMRKLCQELDEAVVWPGANDSTTPLPLSRSKSFSLRLTGLLGSQIITDEELSSEVVVSGIQLHKLCHLLLSLLEDDDLTEHKTSELCEILFGYVYLLLGVASSSTGSRGVCQTLSLFSTVSLRTVIPYRLFWLPHPMLTSLLLPI
jgi:hypothetical protein